MSFVIFIGLGLGAIAWGIKTTEEVFQLSGALIGAILLIWGMCLTPKMFLIITEIVTVIAVFRVCVRCCECD